MEALSEADLARLARLARLSLTEDEATALTHDVDAIIHAFEDLASYAATLPEAAPRAAGAPRPDEVAPASDVTVDGILRAVPELDGVTRLVKVPRGHP